MIGPNFNTMTLSKIKIKPIIRRPEHLIHFLSFNHSAYIQLVLGLVGLSKEPERRYYVSCNPYWRDVAGSESRNLPDR